MMNNAKITQILSLGFAAIGLVFLSGIMSETAAQSGRDPFQKNPVYKKKDAKPRATTTVTKNGKTVVVPKKRGPYIVEAPSAEARINYFRQVREQAAQSGQEIPKPTSVMLLNELSVLGIFRTPRGYAAIVKAEPINLSYTIYPGEKFFDGQLVAVEENRLIFRRVTKWSTGKFVSSVQNKALRKYSDQQTIQGTAPADSYSPKPQTASSSDPKKDSKEAGSKPGAIVSPLDEMNQKAKEEDSKESAKKKSKDKKGSSKRKKVAKKN